MPKLCRVGWHFPYFREVFDWTPTTPGLQYVFVSKILIFSPKNSILVVNWMIFECEKPYFNHFLTDGPGQIDIVIRIGRNGVEHLGIWEFGNCKESWWKWISTRSWVLSFSLSLSSSFSLTSYFSWLEKLWIFGDLLSMTNTPLTNTLEKYILSEQYT